MNLVVVEPRFFSRNLLEEFSRAFVAVKFWVSTADFFKSRAVDALDILGTTTRASDLRPEVRHWDAF